MCWRQPNSRSRARTGFCVLALEQASARFVFIPTPQRPCKLDMRPGTRRSVTAARSGRPSFEPFSVYDRKSVNMRALPVDQQLTISRVEKGALQPPFSYLIYRLRPEFREPCAWFLFVEFRPRCRKPGIAPLPITVSARQGSLGTFLVHPGHLTLGALSDTV